MIQTLFFARGGSLLRYLDLIYLVEQQASIGFDALPGLAELEALGRIDRFFRGLYSIEFAPDKVHEEIPFFKGHRYKSSFEYRLDLTVRNQYAYLAGTSQADWCAWCKNVRLFSA